MQSIESGAGRLKDSPATCVGERCQPTSPVSSIQETTYANESHIFVNISRGARVHQRQFQTISDEENGHVGRKKEPRKLSFRWLGFLSDKVFALVSVIVILPTAKDHKDSSEKTVNSCQQRGLPC